MQKNVLDLLEVKYVLKLVLVIEQRGDALEGMFAMLFLKSCLAEFDSCTFFSCDIQKEEILEAYQSTVVILVHLLIT